jgi:hypothetical protein
MRVKKRPRLRWTEENTEKPVTLVGVPTKIRTELLPNTRQALPLLPPYVHVPSLYLSDFHETEYGHHANGRNSNLVFLSYIKSAIMTLITVAGRCKTRNVFSSWNTGILLLDHIRGTDVCLRFSCLCYPVYVADFDGPILRQR